MQQFADVHDPVMRDRIVDLLRPALTRPGAVYVDATLGLAGHARAILEACPEARLIGIDRDLDAHEVALQRLGPLAERATLVHAVYDELPDILEDLGLDHVDAVLMDLGLSSLQIDRTERGFAYSVDSPLDMRMDAVDGPTAADVLNTYAPGDLVRILRRFGEERFADRIVRAVVDERAREPFTRSGRLVEVIAAAIPAAARYTGGLWVGSFVKVCTYQRLSPSASVRVGLHTSAISTAERMFGHAASADIRVEKYR